MKKKRGKYQKPQLRTKKMYIALEDMDFVWEIDDVKIVIEMWDEGSSFAFISAFMDRDPHELLALLFELREKQMIRDRSAGIFTSQPLEMTKSHQNRINCSFINMESDMYTVMITENLVFNEYQAITFDEMWKSGATLSEISKKIKRRKLKDVLLLMLDRSFNEKINAVPIAIDGRFLSDGDFMGTCLKSIS
ncbi:hypothetical protein [Priestia megaterium]|uniref:hypothetical protein n=1 Tax=Priestia megaterium TaxID=1404 RepID=UPI000BF8DCC5|nr:hypothetical protein [Priestia megaterium]PFR93563.1 hypothetical protein COK39_17905 [Priestia megaterium]